MQVAPDGKHYELVLDREPNYCRALPMAPLDMEPQLRQGRWIVLQAAIWSVPDHTAVSVALSVVKSFKRAIQLGIRPFDYPEEAATWCPSIAKERGSPVSLILRDGVLIDRMVGVRKPGETKAMIRRALG